MNQNNESILTYLTEFIQGLIKYWYIMAISLVICVGGALFYLRFAAKTYKVSASVLLTVERSKAFGGGSDDLMRVNELIERDKNLQNEIYFLQSTPLIRNVIEDMDLQVSYFIQEDKIPTRMEFSLKNLYTDAPFIIIPNKEHFQPVDQFFYVKILDEETCRIACTTDEASIVDFNDGSLKMKNAHFQLGGTYKFGEEVSNPFTSFRILLNSNYNEANYLGKDLFFKFNTVNDIAKQFQSALKVEASSMDATMVELSVRSDHIQKGVDFLNALIQKYIDNSLEEKGYLATKTIEHLDFQLADISKSLGSSERELQDIRRSSTVMNVDERAGNLYSEIQGSENQREELTRRKGYLVQMKEYFESDADTSGLLAPSAMGIEDATLNGLIDNLITLSAERQQIINNNQLRNPRLKTLDISIANMKAAILESLDYSLSTTNNELKEVNRKLYGLNREQAALPQTQRQLLGIERQFNLSENVYMSLLEQKIQAQIIKASTLPDCEIVEPPRFMSIQSPKKLILLIGALFLGVLIPSLFVIGKKLFTTKILTKEELRHYSGLTQIGAIPVSNQRNSINVISDEPNSITSESFHTLRSNLIYYLMGKTNQVILVTSSMEGEGKSFSALNIASSLAVTNNKTILLEFDLRRPSELYSKLGIRGLVGVSSYLINKASLDEIIISSEVENLDFMLAGQIPPNPIELISSNKTQELLDELKKRYDYIIIDTPPYGVLTDSFVLMKYADIKVYVARLGYVKKKIFVNSMEDIASKGIKDIHLVMNGADPKQGSYGKYYTTSRKGSGFLSKRGGTVQNNRKTKG